MRDCDSQNTHCLATNETRYFQNLQKSYLFFSDRLRKYQLAMFRPSGHRRRGLRRTNARADLNVDDMKKCVWVRPGVVARIEHLEWTDGDHLRHAKFAGLCEDKDARNVIKEHSGEA